MPSPNPSVRLLSARLAVGDEQAAAEVANTLREAGGHHERAAKRLGCGVATLHRWLRLPVFRGVALTKLAPGQHYGAISEG